MGSYIAKRLALIVVVLWAVATLVYFLVHVTPGDVAEAILIQTNGTEAVNDQTLAEVREKFDLDQPIVLQYLSWLGKVAQGDFGTSYRYNAPVSDMLLVRLPNTLLLGTAALAISLVIGIPLGIACALKHNKLFDQVSRLLTLGLASFPEFWVALIGIIVFSITLGLLPTSGMNSPLSIVLPACTLSIGGIASTARMMRTSMLDVLGQDFMTAARSKGLSPWDVIVRHGIRNAMPPVITLIALQIGHILGGAVVIESIFSWPGVGELFISAVNAKDTPMIEGCTILIASGYACCNLVADIVYAAIDPRVKYADQQPRAVRSWNPLGRKRRAALVSSAASVECSEPSSAEGGR